MPRKSPIPSIPLDDVKFSLDASGVAGFFGGEVALTAMATVHVYEGRKWLGWFNSPGSYDIGMKYGVLANSRFWDGIFPGVNVDPATLFELNNKTGPKYVAAYSGTIMEQTGHCAALLLRACEDSRAEEVKGRVSRAMSVTIVDLPYAPEPESRPELHRSWAHLLASIPILASLGTCALCGMVEDWYSFSMIALGIVASGIACLVIGSGKLVFSHPRPAEGAPRGDGMLVGDGGLVVLKGEEGAVNSITRGRFMLRYRSQPHYWTIGLCSLLLIVQFLAQLLLIPQGTLFGQVMFVTSLAVSWIYNMYLSSLDGEKVQSDILLKEVLRVHPTDIRKFTLGTRTAAVVFTLLTLGPENPRKQLNDLLPNDTPVWRLWKETVLRKLDESAPLLFQSSEYQTETLDEEGNTLLRTLCSDAQEAYMGYVKLYGAKSARAPSGYSTPSRYSAPSTYSVSSRGALEKTSLLPNV